MRIGIGYDVHRLTEDRDLILGGVKIPFEKGLLGHSDADVLIHAIMDAILGALGAGDIGKHFPDTDPQYKGISSVRLLDHVVGLMQEQGFEIGNLDAIVIAQKPKIGPYFPEMKEHIAQALGCSPAHINLKATTEEGLGFTGRQEGMAAQAVCLLTERV
ncbi:MAG: 2-C-methyl-D-erythritol 2,4-cyclodiphosphate synthase [Clostridiales bacterium]|nr:2-C-methyl-D-erythritol 2,4-cyclodiphosphate synthase [Clostridiales bacterium]